MTHQLTRQLTCNTNSLNETSLTNDRSLIKFSLVIVGIKMIKMTSLKFVGLVILID